MSKKKVLIISYLFPPTGGGGIQRTIKIAKYLSPLGWDPYILTVKPIRYKVLDPSPVDEIPEIPVIRAGSLDPLRLATILRGGLDDQEYEPITSFNELTRQTGSDPISSSSFTRAVKRIIDAIFLPDMGIFWVPFAVFHGVRLCQELNIDAVYSISPRESGLIVGLILKKLTGIPWVMDITDPWSNRYWRLRQPAFTSFINKKLEYMVISGADAIFTTTRVLADYIIGRLVEKKTVRGLNNGFDKDDYSGRTIVKEPGDFNIVHIGNFSGANGVEKIIEGFANALKNNVDFRQSAKLYLIGGNTKKFRALKNKSEFAANISAPGYLPYHDAVKAAAAADLNLLQKGSEVEEAVVPGKFYIYLGAEKPIMAVVPEGEAKRLTTELCKARFLASPEDGSEITDAFLRAFNDRTPQQINWEKAKRYDYENIAGEVAELLDKLTSKSRI
ncbi:MAG: glycosyltransferase family 4 protein [bacterium]|nr:glycosyltransferase family 4 protein [bacterium]